MNGFGKWLVEFLGKHKYGIEDVQYKCTYAKYVLKKYIGNLFFIMGMRVCIYYNMGLIRILREEFLVATLNFNIALTSRKM